MSKCVYRSTPNMSEARKRGAGPSFRVDSGKFPPRLCDYLKNKKYSIKTFGCQANTRDEEIMAGYLETMGALKGQGDELDIVIINTCAVRENAEEKVYGEIGKYKALKEKKPSLVIAVCGCMMQEEEASKTIMLRYPYVSLIFGTHNVPELPSLLDEAIFSTHRLVDVKSFPGEVVEKMPSIRLDGNKAYVNISYGCDKFCTYCIVPYTRGRERSRKAVDILNECQKLVDDGYKDITLLGQNVNSYGKDLGDGTTFAKLLEDIAGTGIARLRFLTSHPWDFSLDIAEAMARHQNIMKWIHLPVQSGSTDILKKMGRRYTREEYLTLVSNIRKIIPECALSTDIIVGFPNETKEEFEDTLTLCEEVGFDSAFTFIYSPRKGTPAAAMLDNVSNEEKHRRFDRLHEAMEISTAKHSEEMVGQVYDVLVDGESKRDSLVLSGYSESNKLFNFKGPSYLKGCIVKVKAVESHTYSIIGELVGDPLIYLANEVANTLKKEPIAKDYLKISHAIELDEELIASVKKLPELKKEMALSLSDKPKWEEAKRKYEETLSYLTNHPLLNNRDVLSPRCEELLLEVKEAIS